MTEPVEKIFGTHCDVYSCRYCLEKKIEGLKTGICQKASRRLRACTPASDNVVACIDYKEKE